MIPKPNMQISNKVANIPEALSVYMNNLVYAMRRKQNDIVTLSLGEAYFDIPFFGFDGLNITKGYHYSESLGLPELREKISQYYAERYSASVDANKELLISAGSKPIIYMALQAVLNEGDEVLVHEPAWLSYPEQIKLAGGVPKYIPYHCPPSEFIQYITDRTRVLILNNPNNPAGRVYSDTELKALYEQLRARGIYLLLDEAYSDFLDDGQFFSMVNLVPDKDGIIVVNSLSKNMGISGWRVGYVISTPKVIYNILKLNQHLITCGPTILLMYLAAHFDEMLRCTLPQAIAVTKKRNEIEQYIRSIGLEPLGGCSTFYLFVSIDDYAHSSLDFAMYLLLKYHIAVVPGSAYGESTERFIRIGVGVESIETLHNALQTIKQVIKTQEFDAAFVDENLKELGAKRFTL